MAAARNLSTIFTTWLQRCMIVILVATAPTAFGDTPDVSDRQVLGISWSSTAAAVEAELLKFVWKPYADVRIYSIRTDRPVLGVAREASGQIQFRVHPIKGLISVAVDYPPSTETFERLSDRLGKLSAPLQRTSPGFAKIVGTRDDRDPRLALVLFDDGKERRVSLAIVEGVARGWGGLRLP